jgi:hypothetical protein
MLLAMPEATARDVIDLRELLPSLFAFIFECKDAPYQVGRVLGSMTSLVIHIAVAYVRGASTDSINSAFTQLRQAARTHLEDTAYSFTFLDDSELVNVVRLIHTSYIQTNANFQPAFVSLNITSPQQIEVEDVEEIFKGLLYSAVIDFLYEGDTESDGCDSLHRGWCESNYTFAFVPRF